VFALGAIALGLIVSTVISSYVTATALGTNLGMIVRPAGYLIAVVLDVGLFVVAFRLLTNRDVSTRDVLPGALLSGLVFWLLQQLSSLIIFHYLHNAERIYGNFATVITILSWFYSQSVVTLVGAQLNVVLKERLHPRRLVPASGTEADHRAYDAYAKERTTSTTNKSTPSSDRLTTAKNNKFGQSLTSGDNVDPDYHGDVKPLATRNRVEHPCGCCGRHRPLPRRSPQDP
jgi:uncharacterized BrkB/YihY/UPF0761 family membrane protein